MYCKFCGEEIRVGVIHDCDKKPRILKFLSWLFEKSGIENPFRGEHEVFERERLVAPDCIELDEGEVPVKQYKVGILRSRMRLQRSEGRLQITNKRILFRATGYSPAGKTVYQHAFDLDKIDGVEIHKDRRFRIPDLIFVLLWHTINLSIPALISLLLGMVFEKVPTVGILLSLILLAGGIECMYYFIKKRGEFFKKLIITGLGQGCFVAIMSLGMTSIMSDFAALRHIPVYIIISILALLGTVLATILYYTSAFFVVVKPNLMIEIKTSSGSPAIQIKHKEISFIWHKCEEFSGFDEILPWEDTDLAIKEVATIIGDIKTLGDLGVDKWKEN